MSFVVTLPWPPTANTYWRRRGNCYFITPKGIDYREFTILKCRLAEESFIDGQRLAVSIHAYPPDKRRRDLDNILKCLLDSLQKAKVYEDDSQIDALLIMRMPERLGKVVVAIKEL